MVDIAIDSSVLIGISHFEIEHIPYARNKSEEPYFDLRDFIINGEINCIITQTVKQEIKHGKVHDKGLAQSFIREKCEVVHPTAEERDLSTKLLYEYGNILIDGRTAIYLAKDKTEKNYRDARIISEMCVEQKMRQKQIPFITANMRDVKDITRINEINRRNGLPEIFICQLSRYMDAINFAKCEEKEHKKEL